MRSCTAHASEDLEVMILKKRHIIEQLARFKRIKDYMVLVAKAKTDYHQRLIDSIIDRYADADQRRSLVEDRMSSEHRYITTHMTLKRTMYKKKLRQKAKQLREDGDERAINVMKLKMRGVLDGYSAEMRMAIGKKMDGSAHLLKRDLEVVK